MSKVKRAMGITLINRISGRIRTACFGCAIIVCLPSICGAFSASKSNDIVMEKAVAKLIRENTKLADEVQRLAGNELNSKVEINKLKTLIEELTASVNLLSYRLGDLEDANPFKQIREITGGFQRDSMHIIPVFRKGSIDPVSGLPNVVTSAEIGVTVDGEGHIKSEVMSCEE